ncbi:MAG TPA: ADP-ribosylglycohydrolase family protein [Solirubrobacteraceae bacterium]|nr:ADP-ribosylglycohydrolase family protein [Solirubrobacteraceae bacterium]
MTGESGSSKPTGTLRAVGALLGTFVGDALGMPWEGAPPDAIPDVLGMEDRRLGAGTYTDDTEMMIALAESLLRCDGVDEDDLARTFLAAYDPRRGYGAGTTQILDLWRKGVRVEEAAGRIFGGQGSLGNGAAMRIAPVSVRFWQDRVMTSSAARRSARLTHAHPVGIDGAAVQAAAIVAALNDDDPLAAALTEAQTAEMHGALADLGARTDGAMKPHDLGEGRGVPPTADRSVAAAVVAASRAGSFEAAVTAAIRAGGDTDTVGAMAGAIAGARFGAAAMPARWIERLEDGERGRRHVEALATRLMRPRADATLS